MTARERLRMWRENPAQFVVDNFAVEPDAWQLEFLRAIGGGYNPTRRVCLKACTGPGKSAALGWAGWLRLSCYGEKGEHPKGAALSISRDNLRDNLWAELSKWQKRSEFLSSQFTWTKERIYQNDHPETWFLAARSFAKGADSETIGNALSGLHSRFPFLLLDETGDQPPAVGQKADQIFTGSPVDALIAQAGNPTSKSGLLYDSCNKRRKHWTVITITADPNDKDRTPRVSVELAQAAIDEYGRDNPWVMATILGLFPVAAFNSLLGVEDVEAAMKRFYRPDQYNFAAKIIGGDAARFGDDPWVLFPRQGLVAFKPKAFRNQDTIFMAGAFANAEDKWQADGTIIDGTGGYGSGVIDILRDLKRNVFDCQFAGKPFNPKYANKRAEIWYEMANWIKGGGALPYVPELLTELTAPTYTYQGDKILIEPKEQVKARIGRSPNYADALAVTFAYPIAPKPVFPQQKTHGEYDPLVREQQARQRNSQRGEFDPFQGGQR